MHPPDPPARRGISTGELCRQLGTTPRAVRYYEQKGLVSPPRLGRDRIYGPNDVARLRLILGARRSGSSLDEARQALAVYDAPPGAAKDEALLRIQHRQLERLRRRRESVAATLLQLEALCADLRERHPELARSLSDGDGRIPHGGAHEGAPAQSPQEGSSG